MTTTPRVVYWNNQPNPYAVARWNAIARRERVALEVWFDTWREPDRSWDVDPSGWRFPYRVIPPRRLAGRMLHVPVPELDAVRPDLVVSGYDQPDVALGMVAARSLAGRVAFRALPSFDAWSDRHAWSEIAKHLLFRAVDGAKVPGAAGRAMCRHYGLPGGRTHDVVQSIDLALYRRARTVPAACRARRRAELGVHGCVFVYAGRLWRGKGLDDLFAAYRRVLDTGADVSLLVIGDGVDEERYRRVAGALPGVVFGGFVQAADLPALYALGDVFVFPTLGDPNGLVVEEALAAGLPVVSSSAAGDIRARVPEGRVGFVVDAARPDRLAARMALLAGDPVLRSWLAANTWEHVERFGLDRYAEDFERFVFATLAAARRHGAAAGLVNVAGRVVRRAERGTPAVLQPAAVGLPVARVTGSAGR